MMVFRPSLDVEEKCKKNKKSKVLEFYITVGDKVPI